MAADEPGAGGGGRVGVAENAVTCFRASGECVFDVQAIEQALAECGEPVETRDGGRLVAWFPPQAGKQYILGVDPAGGGSEGDYACAQVVERGTAMQCAELHGHFPPRELAMRTIALGRSYNDALLVVERNNHGYGVLAHLRAEGSENVFRDGGQDGWPTSAASRPAMVENLAAVLAAEPRLFRSRRLLNECRTFVRYPDGSSGAAAGTHDDCVMAMAIALGEGGQKAAGKFFTSRAIWIVGGLSFLRGMLRLGNQGLGNEGLRGNQGRQAGMFRPAAVGKRERGRMGSFRGAPDHRIGEIRPRASPR